jgi:hypothetical protein
MTRKIRLSEWILPILLFSATALIVYFQALRLPAYLESDQKMVGAVVYSKIKPENYENDYAINNPDFFGSYYPLYVNSLVKITEISGSFENTLSILIAITSFLYMLGMALLFFRFTGYRWLSVIFSIVTASKGLVGPIRDVWGGFMDIRGMRPGNLYLALSTFLFIFLLSVLSSRGNSRKTSLVFWGLLGLGFGLLTNIHQVSALGVVLLSSILVLLAVIRREVRLEFLVVFGGSILIGAIPAILPYLKHAEGVSPEALDFNFSTFYSISQDLTHSVFPSKLWYLGDWLKAFKLGNTVPYSMPLQLSVIITYSILSVGSAAVSFWASIKGRLRLLRAANITLVVIQLIMAVIFTIGRHWISLLLVAYLINRAVVENQLDRADKRLVEGLVIVLGFFPLAFILQWVWRTFEIWQLSTWATQMTRELRFIYLPVYILIARLLALWFRRKDYAMFGFAAALFIWDGPIRSNLWILLFAWAIMVLWSITPVPSKRRRWINEIITFSTILFIAQFILGEQIYLSAVIGLLCLCAVSVIFVVVSFHDYQIPFNSKSMIAAIMIALIWPILRGIKEKIPWLSQNISRVNTVLVLASVLVFLNVFGRLAYYNLKETDTSVKVWLNSIVHRDNTPYLLPGQQEDNELYEWVQNNTPEDSVFYIDQATFRFYAQRSITHSTKDFGQAFFARYLLIDYYNRYQMLESAFDDKDDLLNAVAYSHADYLVADKAKQRLMKNYVNELNWDVVFQNKSYIVYKISG